MLQKIYQNKWVYLLIYSFKQGNLKLRGFVLSQIGFLVELSITLFIWGLFTNQSKDTITYFFVGFIIQRLAWNSFAGTLIQDIVSGKLNNTLILPIKLFPYILIKEIGNKLIGNTLSALTIFVLYPVYRDFLSLPTNTTFWIFFPFLVMIAFLMDYCMSLLTSSIAFFDNDYNGFIRVLFPIFTIASGIRIPFVFCLSQFEPF
jgi:ABC-2 type transport system permease protein